MSRPVVKKNNPSKIIDRIPELWRERFKILGQFAGQRGLPLCLVGGSVRDLFLNKTPLDWDVMVEGDASPLVEAAAKHFSAGVVEHSVFLTYTLHFPDRTSLDVATARQEIYEKPAALPTVRPAELKDDFQRRDFTINAMALHLTPDQWGEIVDPLDGLKDLKKKTVRVLHDKSFVDDPTRIYRAARYAGRHGFKVEPRTLKLIQAAVKSNLPARLTPARLRNELEYLLAEEKPSPAMKLLWAWGIWGFWEENWKWDKVVEKFLSPRKTRDPLLFHLMGLCHNMKPDAARACLTSLAFPHSISDPAALGLESWESLRKRHLPKIPFKKLSSAVQGFLEFAGVPSALLKKWERSEPVLSGMDLNALNYAPGPIYHEIFNAIQQARWSGKVKSAEQEKRFVFDNFPRKK